jgi:ATP/maltotriose-dependent transcriptional regulator MalT
MAAVTMLLQAANLLRQKKAALALSARLACVAHASAMWASGYTCVARHLGDAAVLLGDRPAAHAYYTQALEVAAKIRFRPEMALVHLRLAELLLEEADDPRRSEGLEHLDVAIPELRDMQMQPSLDRALTLSAQRLSPAPPTAVRLSASGTLTTREREIAGLVARGLSNREIASQLVVSEGTVEVHVKHILSKLGFKSRAQVAAWAADERV